MKDTQVNVHQKHRYLFCWRTLRGRNHNRPPSCTVVGSLAVVVFGLATYLGVMVRFVGQFYEYMDCAGTSAVATTAVEMVDQGLIPRSGSQHDDGLTVGNMIPRRLVFTYKENLLSKRILSRPDLTGNLARNVRRTIRMYREAWNDTTAEVDFLLDSDCSKLINATEPRLAEAFVKEEWGPHKSDVCRLVALWDKGGWYHDNDLVTVHVPQLQPSTQFATVYEKDVVAFFQAFLAVTPKHPIMRLAVDIYIDHYAGRQVFPHNFGTHITREAYIRYVADHPEIARTVRIFHERCLVNNPNLLPDHLREEGSCHPGNNVVLDVEMNQLLFESRLTRAVIQRYGIHYS